MAGTHIYNISVVPYSSDYGNEASILSFNYVTSTRLKPIDSDVRTICSAPIIHIVEYNGSVSSITVMLQIWLHLKLL